MTGTTAVDARAEKAATVRIDLSLYSPEDTENFIQLRVFIVSGTVFQC